MVKKEHLSMEEPFAMVTGVNVAPVENYIYTIRGKYVMIDIDLAKLYGVENRSLRQAVRRNTNKFPDDFMFRLMKDEANELINKGVSQNVIPSLALQCRNSSSGAGGEIQRLLFLFSCFLLVGII